MLERDIENNVVEWAKKRGFLTPKVKFVENGWPDRLFISPKGHTIFIEMKRPMKTPEPLQEYRLSELRRRGIPAYWCDTYIQAINILRAALEPEGVSEASRQALAESSISRLVPRSGVGKNFSCPSCSEDIEGKEDDPEGPDYSASERDL